MGSTSSSVSSGWSDSECDDFFYDTGSSSSWDGPPSFSPSSSCAERSLSESELFDSEVLLDDMVFYTVSSLPPYREKVTVRSRHKRRMNQTHQEQNHEVVENGRESEHDHKISSNPVALVGSMDTTLPSSSQAACSTLSCTESPVTSNVPQDSPSNSEKSEAGGLVSDAVSSTPQRKRVRRQTEEEENKRDQDGQARPIDCTEGVLQGDDPCPEHDLPTATSDPVTEASVSFTHTHVEMAGTTPPP